jgi:hypothetical protein
MKKLLCLIGVVAGAAPEVQDTAAGVTFATPT